MKTKLLLTVLFSIGIIGITSAQGLAKNDFVGGPRKATIVKVHEPYKVERKINRHERKKMRREAKKHHRRVVRRHHRHF